LSPLPPGAHNASIVVTSLSFPPCPLPLPPPIPCASIPSLRRADQGFFRSSFAPHSGTQVGPRSPSKPITHQAPARACCLLWRTIAW
jgi:hypothetical protein